MSDSTVPQRPADIVSPITDSVLPNKVSPADARKAGRFGHDKPTPDNTIVLLVDHQIGLMASVRDFSSVAEYKSNVVGLARVAKALNIPTLISSSNAQWHNGERSPRSRRFLSINPSIGVPVSLTPTRTQPSARHSKTSLPVQGAGTSLSPA